MTSDLVSRHPLQALTMDHHQEEPNPFDAIPALLGDNWRHYVAAHRICNDLSKRISDQGVEPSSLPKGVRTVPVSEIRPAPENTLKPADGYLCAYADLLGFSAEMTAPGMDSLPDYYGAAYIAAQNFPSIEVYLLSDSFSAFAPEGQATQLVHLVRFLVSQWHADGLLPQIAIGHGTFVDRRPDFGGIPNNFFGVQLAGTALVDAVNLEKERPFGSRILVSQSAFSQLQTDPTVDIVRDANGKFEWSLALNVAHELFDCLYYFMCLRDLQANTRLFSHYVWSIASRVRATGDKLLHLAVKLVQQHYELNHLHTVVSEVAIVLHGYEMI